MTDIERNDLREAALQMRIKAMYQEALDIATERLKDFLRKKQQVDDGKIKPPAYYDTPEKVERWKAGFVRELIRQYRVEEVIMEEICKAGKRATDISIHAPPRGATAKDMQFLQIFCSTLTNQHGLTIVPRNLSRLFW